MVDNYVFKNRVGKFKAENTIDQEAQLSDSMESDEYNSKMRKYQ